MNQTLFNESSRAMLFIFKHYPPALNWADPLGYCAFYISNGYMGMVIDDESRIVAVCTARPIMKPGDGAIAYRHDPEGSCIFIDLLVTEKPDWIPIQGLRLLFQDRFGHRKQVAYFNRFEQGIKVHDYDQFVRNISRKAIGKEGNASKFCTVST